jgi:adenylate cyclase
MADLVAYGPDGTIRWRHLLTSEPVTLGRVPQKCTWDVSWDPQVSSVHVTLAWQGSCLQVHRVEKARNPVRFNGKPLDDFTVGIGESFVIGKTTFTVEAGDQTISGTPMASGSVEGALEQAGPSTTISCSHHDLLLVRYQNPEDRIRVLATLPELIRFSPSDKELERRVVEVLLAGMPAAQAAAVVRYRPAGCEGGQVEVRTAQIRDQGKGSLRGNRRLVDKAVNRSRQSEIYCWETKDAGTPNESFDWAMCVPLPEDPVPGWAVYITGSLNNATLQATGVARQDALMADMKFAVLVADIFSALRQVRDLQNRHGVLARFLSRQVVEEMLVQEDLDTALRARTADVTVLFCDLRGSSRMAEKGRGDLEGLWGRVSAALGIMTSNISDNSGVIGDFQGDAAMGFWGWPKENADQVEQAARAALQIWRDFRREAREGGNQLLQGFTCGIGLATGPAIAGKLGTYDQFKVGVFGPVVNLASRLESLTKLFKAPILIDEATAQQLNARHQNHWYRCRRLARVRPAGMDDVVTISELLGPQSEPEALREQDRKNYEAALDAFQVGRWDNALELLRSVWSKDGPAQFLRSYMEDHGRKAPTGWDGIITQQSK